MRKGLPAATCAMMLILGGCGNPFGTAKKTAQPTTTAVAVKPTGPKRAGHEKIDVPVEEAMAKIPPNLRETFQSAMACDIKKSKGKSITVNADYVNSLLTRLKSDPSIAKC